MKKAVFLQKLAECLGPLSDSERNQAVEYFGEVIDDGMDSGKSEEEAVDAVGSVDEIATEILREKGVDGNAHAHAQVSQQVYESVSEVKDAVIDTRDMAVELVPVRSDHITIRFAPGARDQVDFSEENGVFTFRHRIKFVLFGNWVDILSGPRPITVEVPADFSGSLHVRTSNQKLKVKDFKALDTAEFVTSNAKLKIEHLICAQLLVHTSNASLELNDIHGRSCQAETSNGKIKADDCTFDGQIHLHTSNAKIEAEGIVSDHITYETGNAAVQSGIIGDMRDYAVHSHTSNASSSLPEELAYPEQKKDLNVRTSNAKIEVYFKR